MGIIEASERGWGDGLVLGAVLVIRYMPDTRGHTAAAPGPASLMPAVQ